MTADKAIKVLVVDDDETILRSLRVALGHAYTVFTCNTATRGVVEARIKQPNVIILDIRMPDHDGFWLFKEIRKFDQTTPIIFNSAYQDLLTNADLEAYLPVAYLPKSGNLKQLLATIEAALNTASGAKR